MSGVKTGSEVFRPCPLIPENRILPGHGIRSLPLARPAFSPLSRLKACRRMRVAGGRADIGWMPIQVQER